ncbi:MAG: YqgE/AlgH family protein, partial [Bdellovibrionales bacterium]
GDARFQKSVIFICAHDEHGAMGLTLNKPLTDLNLGDLLSDLKIDCEDHSQIRLPVYIGGPLEPERGFLLHSSAHNRQETTKIGTEFGVSGTLEALESVTDQTKLPKDMMFALGYAGWDAGQLEQELKEGAWLVSEAFSDIVFETDRDMLWDQSMKNLGIDPSLLTGVVGQA